MRSRRRSIRSWSTIPAGRAKGFRPSEELSPPDRLLAGFHWQSRELEPADVATKRLALAAHRTQYGYSASRLLPFVRSNELYGDLTVPDLAAAGGAVDLQGLSVRRVGNQLEIGMALREPLGEESAVSLSAVGYRPDVPFAAMPKLEIRIAPHAWTVRDQGQLLPRTAAWGGTRVER